MLSALRAHSPFKIRSRKWSHRSLLVEIQFFCTDHHRRGTMAAPKKDLSAEDAQTEAFAALDNDATIKITLTKQSDGKWTITIEP